MTRILYLLLFISCSFVINAQTVNTEFGKNRIQHHDDFDKWNMYETENFITYWYGKGRNIAHTVVQMAELDNDGIRSVLEHRFNDKIEIIVYLDLTDLKQSNLGSEEVFVSNSGRTKILGNKMFVYFDGNHQHLRKQIREGIAGVYIESMLYGSNLQEIVQNAVLLNLPEWYKDGLISFLGSDWDVDIDNELRDILSQKKKYFDFYRLAKDYPRVAGHSLWYFISQQYGKSNITNLLYLTRINRSLENGFLYNLGTSYEQVTREWSAYFKDKYEKDAGELNTFDESAALPIKNKRKIPFANVTLSPDGQTLAYVMNERGKKKVFLYDIASGKKARIFKYGVKNYIQETDYNYPVIAWSKDSRFISFMYEKRDIIYLSQLDLESDELITQALSPEFHRVYGMDYWTMDTLILNASTDGFSDLYLYFPERRASERVTEDFHDDLHASVVNFGGKKGILFASNRLDDSPVRKEKLDTILPIEAFNIFFLSWHPNQTNLRQLTFSNDANHLHPSLIDGEHVMFLSDESGIWNRKLLSRLDDNEFDERFISNTNRNIITHHSTGGSSQIVEVTEIEGQPKIFLSTLQPDLSVTPYTVSQTLNQDSENQAIIISNDGDDKIPFIDKGDDLDERFFFQTEFEIPDEVVEEDKKEEIIPMKPEDETNPIAIDLFSGNRNDRELSYKPSELTEFINARTLASRLRFKLDFVNTTMDNSLLFGGLDSYAGTKREYETPPLGILLKANLKDLFEDYVFEGGARFPTSFNGSEYFITFDDKKKKLDKRYALYRQVTTETFENGLLGIERNQFVSVIGQYTVRYPFDVYSSVRATGTIRNDRLIELVTERSNLNNPIIDEQRIGLRLEYVYDNTLEIDMNIRNGSRAKAWVEVVKKFDLNLNEPGKGLEFNNGFMTVVGVDARHYVRLDRNSIFAARFTASTSFGSEQILYYLGGVENALFAEFDNNIPVPQDKNFAYQTLAAQLRGFQFNARNGASVALVNTELRVPFMKYLSKRKIKSSFFRNLQVVGFFDVGTAWHGTDPFSDDNPLNTVNLSNPPTVNVQVKYFRNPIVFGYGAGVRTLLFGYFLKLDYAWGWETGLRQDPMLHFSIGTDF